MYQHLPMPVPTTVVTPVAAAATPTAGPAKAIAPERSPLQKKFPHVHLPSSHPLYLLQPVSNFQPHSQLLEALTEMGISSRAASKALFWTGNRCLQTAADWCFSNPGREMELMTLEEEVVMWMQELEIREEDEALKWAEVVRELMREEMERGQAAQVRRWGLGL